MGAESQRYLWIDIFRRSEVFGSRDNRRPPRWPHLGRVGAALAGGWGRGVTQSLAVLSGRESAR
jgi:hypothetical protein